MNPYVKSVQTQENYCLLLTFENGEKRIFDLKPFLDKGIFARLKDVAWFKTARVVSGSIEWRGEIDLSYDTLYLSSVPVKTNKNRLKASQKAKKKLATITSKRNKRTRTSVEAK